MKKKLFSLLTALLLCLFCAVSAFAEMPLVMDTYTHTTETETYDPVKDDSSSSSSGSSTDSDGFGGSSRRKILRVSILTTAAAFFAKAAAGLLSEFFVITMRNVLLFRGAANTKKLLQRLIHAAGVFLLFPFQPEHLKLPVSVGLVLVEFLGLDVALEGTVKLQGVPVLLNVGQHAGNGGFLALKLRFAVP